MSKVFDLWKEIGGAFGPSGREDAVREAIAAAAGDYVDDITTGKSDLPEKGQRQKTSVCGAHGFDRRGGHVY